jgi:hypothetical protein
MKRKRATKDVCAAKKKQTSTDEVQVQASETSEMATRISHSDIPFSGRGLRSVSHVSTVRTTPTSRLVNKDT